ncbi:hypothetical protein M0R45_019693 [Rubus argutus]|uniref:Uncharacterized protein n=1 Tax=Rubus argutus TaxID=59490 RepID=A0AAW1X7Q1_RUBAR
MGSAVELVRWCYGGAARSGKMQQLRFETALCSGKGKWRFVARLEERKRKEKGEGRNKKEEGRRRNGGCTVVVMIAAKGLLQLQQLEKMVMAVERWPGAGDHRLVLGSPTMEMRWLRGELAARLMAEQRIGLDGDGT